MRIPPMQLLVFVVPSGKVANRKNVEFYKQHSERKQLTKTKNQWRNEITIKTQTDLKKHSVIIVNIPVPLLIRRVAIREIFSHGSPATGTKLKN